MISASIARRYAQALLGVALENQGLETLQKDMETFDSLFREHPDLLSACTNRTLPLEERRQVLESVIKKVKVSDSFRRFLLLVNDKQRLTLFSAMHRELDLLAEKHSGIMHATLTSAVALKDETQKEIAELLERMTGRKIALEAKEDPSLVGGLTVKLGNTIFDGSVATHLENLKRHMIENEMKG